jgi:hypothetical protein
MSAFGCHRTFAAQCVNVGFGPKLAARQRDDVRPKMRVAVKRITRRHGYPPDQQSEAVKLAIKQAEAMGRAVL